MKSPAGCCDDDLRGLGDTGLLLYCDDGSEACFAANMVLASKSDAIGDVVVVVVAVDVVVGVAAVGGDPPADVAQ